MKKHIISILILSFLTACVADLRTQVVKDKKDDKTKGRELLTKAGEAHLIKNWKKIATYSVEFQDEFIGFKGKIASPFKENPMKAQLDYIPLTFDGRMRFLEGEHKNQIWGIQSWNTYTMQHEKASPVFEKDKNIKFWVPTYQYFIEFPARIQEAGVVTYAGEDTFEGKEYHLVMASWGTTDPQKDVDQYLIWINKESYRIEMIQYTVRDAYSFVQGTAIFKEFRELNGVLIPFHIPVKAKPNDKKNLHEMRIRDFRINQVDVKTLQPKSKEELENLSK